MPIEFKTAGPKAEHVRAGSERGPRPELDEAESGLRGPRGAASHGWLPSTRSEPVGRSRPQHPEAAGAIHLSDEAPAGGKLPRPLAAMGEFFNQGWRTARKIAGNPSAAFVPSTYLDAFASTARAGLTGEMGPAGFQAEHEDPISATVQLGRKARALGSFVAVGQMAGAADVDDFIARSNDVLRQMRADDLGTVLGNVFQIESLGASLLRSGGTLDDARIDPRAQPIAHTGLGVESVQRVGFDPLALRELIDLHTHPAYRAFSYEAIGSGLAALEPGVLRTLGGVARSLGLPALGHIAPPADPGAFVRAFDPPTQRLIANGFGRLLAFKSHDLRNAVALAKSIPYLDLPSVMEGVGSAYTNFNSSDLPGVLRAIDQVEPALRPAFRAGVAYSLQFAEWTRPGVLAGLGTLSGHPLVEGARLEVAGLRERGQPLPLVR